MTREEMTLSAIKHIISSGQMKDSTKVNSVKGILAAYEESFKNG
jgi:hypothetical protein